MKRGFDFVSPLNRYVNFPIKNAPSNITSAREFRYVNFPVIEKRTVEKVHFDPKNADL